MLFPEIYDLLDLNHTVAKELFSQCKYPWDVLPLLSDFIRQYGRSLPTDAYTEIKPEVWVHNSVKIAPTADLTGPTVIGAGTEVRPCAYIRGSALIGEGCVIGNSTEIKNAILFDGVQVPHYNYVGDSVLGYRSHMGAGSVASNVRSDKANVTVTFDGEKIKTGLRKFATVLGDFADVGCNSVLCPGSIVGRRSIVYPLSRVRGFVPQDSIFKANGVIVERKI